MSFENYSMSFGKYSVSFVAKVPSYEKYSVLYGKYHLVLKINKSFGQNIWFNSSDFFNSLTSENIFLAS